MKRKVLAIRHVPHESLGTLQHYLEAAGMECEYLDAFKGSAGDFNPRDWTALIVLGGPMSVDQTDRYPFLATELDWIRQALDAQLPLLGICLGAQLLAKALGSRVYPNGVKEIGWYPIEITAKGRNDSLFAGSQRFETVFHWHGDTFDLPTGAVLLASSEECKHQAFRFGHNAWGLQFHLEMTGEMVDDWLVEPENCGELSGLEYIHPEAILAQTPAQLSAMSALAERVFGRFAQMCGR
jgi:GMP synthase (glutamine-hydrolysing)